MRVLLVEDSDAHVQLVRDSLRLKSLTACSTVAEGRRLLSDESWSLLLLDLYLPDGNGLDLVAEAKRKPSQFGGAPLPVLLLTSANAIVDKVAAFTLGADDYLVKPFEPVELQLRAERLLRQGSRHGLTRFDDALRVGDLLWDSAQMRAMQLTEDGSRAIDLTPTEFKLGLCLVKAMSQVVPRERLKVMAWGSKLHVEERVLDSHISRLRKKLQPTRMTVASIYGVGYRASVRDLSGSRFADGC